MSTTERLPLLPLDDTVVLPGMVVPVELGDAEARVAVDAAGTQDGPARVLLVPRLNGRYGGIGTIAVVEQVGRLPGGEPGCAWSAAPTACGSAPARPGPGAALWVEVDRARRRAARASAPRSWPGSTRRWSSRSCSSAARGRWSTGVQQVDDPSALADIAGYAAYLDDDAEAELLETADVVRGWRS